MKRPDLRAGILAGVGLVLTANMPHVYAADTNHGRELYATHCVSCHGSAGVPVMPGTPDFTRLEGLLQPDPVLVQGIKAGKNAMPGFQGLLRDRDILDVIAYVRTLR